MSEIHQTILQYASTAEFKKTTAFTHEDTTTFCYKAQVGKMKIVVEMDICQGVITFVIDFYTPEGFIPGAKNECPYTHEAVKNHINRLLWLETASVGLN